MKMQISTGKRETTLIVITTILAMLFFYAAFIKLTDYDKASQQMHNQVFPSAIANILTWLIPVIEMILLLALLFPISRIKALWVSLLLLTAFSVYIFLAMNHFFGRTPCGCGGILGENTPYSTHLIFNLFFVGIAVIGLIAQYYQWIKNNSFNHNHGKELARN